MKLAWLVTVALAALLPGGLLLADPVVSNVTASQRATGDRAVDIAYDVSEGSGAMTVSLLVSNDNGANFNITPRTEYLTGDVGPGITNGAGYSIVWDAMADVPEIYWPQTRVRVIATEESGEPGDALLTITSDELDPVHQSANQTLTFTFSQPVTDFDASDISVTGATKGTFDPVSSTVYTVDIVGLGGTISVAVAQNVTSPGNIAATFSNFYQDTWTLDLDGGTTTMELIRIPAGTFMMGAPLGELSRSSDEIPHEVTISQDFYLGKTEVTQQQWTAVQSLPFVQNFVGATMPVHNVSAIHVQSWLTALDTAITDAGTFGLPTEAQWEYACRAGTTTRFSFGNGFGISESCSAESERTDNMWYCGNSGSTPKVVGQKLANAWGLKDMHGNLAEWCSDSFGTYPAGPVTDPTGVGSSRVIRGGRWSSEARFCRSAKRDGYPGSGIGNFIGFRVLAMRPTGLTISSSELADVHETQNQTLTFTFGQPVTAFDASDVTVTGATKGAFSGSGSVYTMDIAGLGGSINVSVAENVASPSNQAATFSNFYQDTWTITLPGSVPMELIRIPAGTFTMGSPEGELSRLSDETQHEVTITQDYYLGKTEVTQQQWLAVRGVFPHPSGQIHGLNDNRAVHLVSYADVQTFMTDLTTAITGAGTFSLPTEAQWEYAARAGTTTRFNFGEGFGADEECSAEAERTDNMWYCGNNAPLIGAELHGTKIVGQKPANAWGLLDMHGNVSEFVSDWYAFYPGSVTDPTGPATGTYHLYRGGDWSNGAHFARSAVRLALLPEFRYSTLGFRVRAVRSASLNITSTEAGAVHQSAAQTLTFTFDEAVTDFDLSDIALTGATPGAFTQITPDVYTLEVEAPGGRVTVSVAADAATVSAPSMGHSAASFSNFYQDTWTLDLPGNVPMELIRIPAGTFTMGSPWDELSRATGETQHEVTISKDFYLGKTEVTQRQWTAIQPLPAAQSYVGETMPVHNADWNVTQSWLAALDTAITEPGFFSLPTESQWEYACRAGTTTRFSFGNAIGTDEGCSANAERTDNMWYCGNNSPIGTKFVGQKLANPWGLRDMHGNVYEWCADWNGTYPAGPVTDPSGPASGTVRIARGGGWSEGPSLCRSAQRVATEPQNGFNLIGFRVLAVRSVSLNITSTEAGAVHQSAAQTLTFTFDDAVTDFDLSDIGLAGATAGAFTQVTPDVYTLEVEATGGTIIASVAADAATVSAPNMGHFAASFSNFYQDTWTLNLPEGVPLELIRIPAGTFTMGSPVGELSRSTLEVPHEVTISQDFYLGKTEVTQQQWAAIMSFPLAQTYVGNTMPVHNVSRPDVQSWLVALNNAIIEPGAFALPTESQLEYACRAGTTTRFNFGDGFASNETSDTTGGRGENMWFSGNNSPTGTKVVGQKPANAWGLRDMHGNVWEWSADWNGDYPAGPVTDPTGPVSGSHGMIRGGSWMSTAAFSRSAMRNNSVPSVRNIVIGFRLRAVR